VDNTGELRHFKLHGISGAYWRADKNNQALQRISGTAFFTKEDLKQFEQRRADAIKYEHRKVGKELDLFSFHDEGPGFPFFHPNGMIVINELKRFLRKKLDALGYLEISTPTMMDIDLWKQSGHYSHYKENMYFSTIDEREYAIKPMNCPGAILVYKDRPHSYRELPMRLAEFGHVHRYELSGVLHGLFRVRAFTQDDAHIFCTPEQIEAEVLSCLQLANDIYSHFGFTVHAALATRPEKSMGHNEAWDKATEALKSAFKKAKMDYVADESGGAFYGPKIDLQIEDSLGRKWQCCTVQVDYTQPENFDLGYVTPEGTKARPVIIHRAIYGSFERFFGILLEHFKGKLPFWLSPVQIKLLTITDEQGTYAQKIMDQLKSHDVRVSIDESSDPISGKIKRAQIAQVPWMLVLGQKEMDQNTVTLRHRDGKQEFGVTMDQLLEKIAQERA
jgi:threonyl-tRNA synthetase